VVSEVSVKKIAERLAGFENPVIVCHIDADGLTSGAIIFKTLEKMGKEPEIIPLKQLDPSTYDRVPWDAELIFVDLGAGQTEWTRNHVIIDHHEPEEKTPYQLNAHFLGLSGSRDISSSGLSYLVSKELIGESELAGIAVVGMVGDQIDRKPLQGYARIPLSTPWVKPMKGLRYFGRETRILPIFLEYASDPFIPGLSGELAACYEFLERIGIDPEKTYHELEKGERRMLNDELIKYASRVGVRVHRMVGEYYILPHMPEKTEMRDATEFATLLNACGRHEKAKLGIELLLGRNVYDEAKKLLRKHRMLLSRGMREITERGTREFKNFQLFVSEEIKPTIIGIVAGIAISSRSVNPNKPIIAVSPDIEGEGYKISGRATMELVERGIDLGKAMREASEGIGEGGGHDIAAGAFVPFNQLEKFLRRLDYALGKQFNRGKNF